MLTTFWETVGGKLADRWAALAGPAVVFWAGGVLAWAFAGSGWSRLSKITKWLNDQGAASQLATLLGVLVVVAASVVVVQRLTAPTLRLLEGYWPAWLGWLSRRLRNRASSRNKEDDEAWQRLQQAIEQAEPTAEQLAELAGLERRRRHCPNRSNRLLPTRTGNILRAAETRPFNRYGLEAVTIWPHLWLVLPDSAREEVAAARGQLDASVSALIWGAGFVAFTPLTWWAAVAGFAVAAAAERWWVPSRAEVFADLVEAAIDLYRIALYRQLRWPLPETPAQEEQLGQQLTQYLLRGSDADQPTFAPPT